MSKVRLIGHGTINEGHLDAFKAITKKIVQNVRDVDPDTLDYSWYIDDSALTFTVVETYGSWSGLVAHAMNLGPNATELGGMCRMTLEAFATEAPPAEAEAILKRFGAPVTMYFDGLE